MRSELVSKWAKVIDELQVDFMNASEDEKRVLDLLVIPLEFSLKVWRQSEMVKGEIKND